MKATPNFQSEIFAIARRLSINRSQLPKSKFSTFFETSTASSAYYQAVNQMISYKRHDHDQSSV